MPRNPGRIRPFPLRKIDALLQGELSDAEAGILRQALESDPMAKAYLERQAALKSRLTVEAVQEALRKREERGIMARARAWAGSLVAAGVPGRPRKGWLVGVAFACAAVGLTVWTRYVHPDPAPVSDSGTRFQAKGGSRAEFMVRLRGLDYAAGELVPARSGDTLSFSFRSADSLHVQAWYQEDGQAPAPFAGPAGFVLPPATSWTVAPQRIRLEGNWRRQQVWILLSREPLDRETVAEGIRRGEDFDAIRVLTYRLAPPQE